MKFLKLTSAHSSYPIYVNMERVSFMQRRNLLTGRELTFISFKEEKKTQEYRVWVMETPEEIFKAIQLGNFGEI